jgi:uncharacterized protein
MSPSRRAARALAGVAILLASAACGGAGAYPARPAPESLPGNSPLLSRSLGETDAWLRHYLMEGKPDSALRMLADESRVRPRDELLRRLQMGVVLHSAGKWEESNAAFAWAEAEAEARWTRSLAQQAGSMLLNDAVVEYVPAPGELAMIPYYRLLNYLAMGSADDALVEARKASDLLGRLSQERAPCVGDGFVHYLAGVAFRGAGERNDALVAYRNAERAFGACAGRDAAGSPGWLGTDLYRAALEAGVREVADSALSRYRLDPSSAAASENAELVVFVENGWVAHRSSADIHVPIFPEQMEELNGGGNVLDAATQVVARLVGNLAEQSYWGEALDERPEFQLADALSGAYVMKLAWPEYRLEAAQAPRVRVRVDESEADVPVVQDVSAVMFRRWAAQRPGVFTRVVGRGILKYLAVRELEKKAEKEDESLGWLVGRVGNAVGNALERADTRSWSLLPDRISVARFSLPPGQHRVTLEVLGGDGAVADTVDLGTVELAPGGTLILNRRVWGTEMGDLRRLAEHAAGAKLTSDAQAAPVQ